MGPGAFSFLSSEYDAFVNGLEPHFESLPTPRRKKGRAITSIAASPVNDAALCDQAIADLRATGRIEYRGEFGAEIATFVPFAAWLKREGLLAGRRVVSYAGMQPYYFFLGDGEFEAKPGPRDWLHPHARGWPSNSTYTATRSPWHVYPDFRGQYAGRGRPHELPTLFIQNKFTVEWAVGPINFLPLIALERLLTSAQGRFHVVYSRPGIARDAADYSADHNRHCDYPDRQLVARFAGVEILEDMAAGSEASYNALKLGVLGQSRLFVAVQGGGAHLLACFGGSLMLLLHRFGEEYPHAYRAGAYTYLSDPPPVMLVAQAYDEFNRGIGLFDKVSVVGDTVTLKPEARADFDRLRV